MFQQHFLLSRTNPSRERKNRKDRNRETERNEEDGREWKRTL